MTRPIISTWPDATDPFQELPDSHSGLDFAYGPGRVRDDNVVADVAAGSITLADAATNYVEVTGAGAVSANATGFTAGQIPLYTVVTAAGAISTVTDRRAFLSIPGSSGGGGGATVEGTRITHSTTFTAASGSFTTVPFDTETEDDAGWHDTATNNSRVTIATAGWIDVDARIELPVNTTGSRVIRILLNGATEVSRVTNGPHGVAANVFGISTKWKVSAGDYIELQVYQDSGSTLTCNTNGLSDLAVTQVR